MHREFLKVVVNLLLTVLYFKLALIHHTSQKGQWIQYTIFSAVTTCLLSFNHPQDHKRLFSSPISVFMQACRNAIFSNMYFEWMQGFSTYNKYSKVFPPLTGSGNLAIHLGHLIWVAIRLQKFEGALTAGWVTSTWGTLGSRRSGIILVTVNRSTIRVTAPPRL